jgi:5-formyltetrahydrofolate cyclo-ligase
MADALHIRSKSEYRLEGLQRRNAIAAEARAAASLTICQSVMADNLFLDARGVHVYLPIGSEVDVRPLIDVAWELGKEVGFMRVLEDGGSRQFLITPDTKFRTTKLGILEPVDAEQFDMETCDLVIAPLVAADEKCNRLGYGKGYYDQLLIHNPRPTIGVAFDEQIFADIPIDEGDVRLDKIYTERRAIVRDERLVKKL